MHILHIANDYAGSKVYKSLFTEIDCAYGVQQTVYTAIRSHKLQNLNKATFKNKSSQVIYSLVLNIFTKLFYGYKLSKVVSDIERHVDFSQINLIHAHTWYSDGGVALKLSQKYKIPYVVTVRSSDTHVFFRYMVHLRSYGRRILNNADQIIFVTPVYRDRVLNNKYFARLRNCLMAKVVVIPNALAEFWHNNYLSQNTSTIPLKAINLIYVGTFIARKNVLKVLEAVELLKGNGRDVRLTLVGGGGGKHDEVLKQIRDKAYFNFLGKIVDKQKLLETFRGADIFVMPSERETFGLVYLEAISQGLPIIYLNDDGVDGLFEDNVGRGVNKKDIIKGIVSAVQDIADNPRGYSFNAKDKLKEFRWSISARRHVEIYNQAMRRKPLHTA